jgi:hypothetical protein
MSVEVVVSGSAETGSASILDNPDIVLQKHQVRVASL